MNLPSHCGDCGVPLMGGATRHKTTCTFYAMSYQAGEDEKRVLAVFEANPTAIMSPGSVSAIVAGGKAVQLIRHGEEVDHVLGILYGKGKIEMVDPKEASERLDLSLAGCKQIPHYRLKAN